MFTNNIGERSPQIKREQENEGEKALQFFHRSEFEKLLYSDGVPENGRLVLERTELIQVFDALKYAIHNTLYDNNKENDTESKLYWDQIYTHFGNLQSFNPQIKILKNEESMIELYRLLVSYLFSNFTYFNQLTKHELLEFISSFVV